MSTAAPSSRLGWRLLPGVLAASAAVIAGSLLLAALRDNPVEALTFGPPAAPAASVAEAGAPWAFATRPIGMHAKLDKAQKARFQAQRGRVAALIEDLVDATVLDPGRLQAAVRGAMVPSAATAFRKTVPAIPATATDIRAVRRSARVGIQAPAFKSAAVRAKVTMRATIDGRLTKWRNDITFWMQREGKTWKVLAFDLARVPQ